MFTTNPFADLTAFLSAALMQAYVVLMILAVAAGTLFDVVHKSSGKYFAQYRERTKARATRRLSGGDKASLAARTLMIEVAAAGEFCNQKRRVSHLLMFYGFLIYLITTVVMVFLYLGEATPIVLPVLWNIGALMVVVGGYWFFFLLRVDVVHDGRSPFRLVRADLFIVSLLASVTFALAWEIVQANQYATVTKVMLALYLFFTTLLFVSVPWSKFSHMFYKPVMAFQRRVEEADGSSSLPTPADGYKGRI
jgi:hypothetical protein